MKPTLVFPCKYDFSLMPKTDKGSFCKSCNKVLKDFSKLSDSQLKSELSTVSQNTCGHFREDQISFHSNTFLVPAFKVVSLSILSLLGGTLLPNELNAQVKQQTQQVSKMSSALSKLKFPLTIKGTLKERDGKMPIAFSKVIFRQKNKTIKSAYTNAEGNFLITLKRTDVVDTNFQLILSQAGYKNDTLKTSLNKTKETLIIKMDIAIAIVDFAGPPLIDGQAISGAMVMSTDFEKPQEINTIPSKKLTRKERRLLKAAKTTNPNRQTPLVKSQQ